MKLLKVTFKHTHTQTVCSTKETLRLTGFKKKKYLNQRVKISHLNVKQVKNWSRKETFFHVFPSSESEGVYLWGNSSRLWEARRSSSPCPRRRTGTTSLRRQSHTRCSSANNNKHQDRKHNAWRATGLKASKQSELYPAVSALPARSSGGRRGAAGERRRRPSVGVQVAPAAAQGADWREAKRQRAGERSRDSWTHQRITRAAQRNVLFITPNVLPR